MRVFLDAMIAPLALLLPSLLTSRTRATVAWLSLPTLVAVLLQQPPSSSLTAHPMYVYSWWASVVVVSLFWLALVAGGLLFAHVVLKNRQPANPTACQEFEEQVQQGRVVCGDGYDIYLPESPSSTSSSSSSASSTYAAGMIFVPGALVDHRAYAGILRQLADRGIVTVMLNLDPLRMPVPFYRYSTPAGMKTIMQQVQTVHQIQVQNWTLAGHSAGASTVADMVRKQQLGPDMNRVVLWGIVTTQDLEHYPHVRGLCVAASKDGFKGNSMGRGAPTFDSWEALHPRLQYVEVQGGNHGGFADYPHQTFPRNDGERDISLAEQHRQVVQATAQFLLSHKE